MANFTASGESQAGTNLGIVTIAGAAAARPTLHHIIIGSPTTPANQAGDFRVQSFTTAGVGGTGLTEVELDLNGTAPLCTATEGTYSTEPVWALEFLRVPLNQQATFQWWANPGFEPKTAVGTANGIGLESQAHTATPNIQTTMMWSE